MRRAVLEPLVERNDASAPHALLLRSGDLVSCPPIIIRAQRASKPSPVRSRNIALCRKQNVGPSRLKLAAAKSTGPQCRSSRLAAPQSDADVLRLAESHEAFDPEFASYA